MIKKIKNCYDCVFSEGLMISQNDKLKDCVICHQLGDYVKTDVAEKCEKYRKKDVIENG